MTSGLVVLDTNVVLDWLLFRDSAAAALAQALQTGRLRWLVCTRMRDELEHTLAKPQLARWAPNAAALLAAFDRHAVCCPHPPTLLALRCDDPDDQVFLDLAFAQRAGLLVTHDRALLRLRKRAGANGLRIIRPADFLPKLLPPS